MTDSPGAAFRTEVLELYELTPPELALLDEAVVLIDTLKRIEVQLAESPLTGRGSRGQQVANPLLRAQRDYTLALARVVEGLALPMPDELEGESPTTKRARRAATIRWSKENN